MRLLFEGQEIGDRTPPQFYRNLKKLAAPSDDDARKTSSNTADTCVHCSNDLDDYGVVINLAKCKLGANEIISRRRTPRSRTAVRVSPVPATGETALIRAITEGFVVVAYAGLLQSFSQTRSATSRA